MPEQNIRSFVAQILTAIIVDETAARLAHWGGL